jgi:hypothetical protein
MSPLTNTIIFFLNATQSHFKFASPPNLLDEELSSSSRLQTSSSSDDDVHAADVSGSTRIKVL